MLERAHWSDDQGNCVQFAASQSPRHCTDSWEPVITTSTDSDGWLYASVFRHGLFGINITVLAVQRHLGKQQERPGTAEHRHLDYTREGGRASQRATDFVRRRLWRKKAASAGHPAQMPHAEADQAAPLPAEALVSPATIMLGTRLVHHAAPLHSIRLSCILLCHT